MPSTRKTDDALVRIEQTLEALCAEVAAIRQRVETLDDGHGAMKTSEIVEFLDQYRAAEAMAAAGFGAWVAQSDTACLRGGLRVVQLREAAHARLFEERIKELGGSPKAELPQEAEDFLLGLLGDASKTDAEKLQAFLGRAGDPKVLEQLESQAARMDDDQETQSLLRAVIEDERASLALLRQACELLCG
jgi:hypothetical protein